MLILSGPGSLQRSFMSGQLENKHINRLTVISLSVGSGSGHMLGIIIITACAVADIQHTNRVNDDMSSDQPAAKSKCATVAVNTALV